MGFAGYLSCAWARPALAARHRSESAKSPSRLIDSSRFCERDGSRAPAVMLEAGKREAFHASDTFLAALSLRRGGILDDTAIDGGARLRRFARPRRACWLRRHRPAVGPAELLSRSGDH